MATVRRWVRALRERRAARRQRAIETARRRAAEGHDEPPISMTNPGG